MLQNLAEKLQALWDSADSLPDVFGFLEQHADSELEAKLAVLRVDQQRRWKTDEPLKVEDYLARLPDLADSACKVELAVGEFKARQNSESSPSVEEYLSRFSDISDTLRQKLADSDTIREKLHFATTETFDSTQHVQRIGRYRILRVLGEGAFGRVLLAFDDELKRQVAIKIPKPERFQSAEDAESYLAEARMVASLDHPHIVPVHDVGRTDEGAIYVVSKFVEGHDLKTVIEQNRLEYAEAAKLLAVVADALHHAHQKRLIHRDIKPANILIEDATHTPYVVDFGLAITEEDYLKSGRLAGTPAYMSPELARGEGHRLDGRSDIFSVGIVFYELLTGKQPFHGSSSHELMVQISTTDPQPPRQRESSIPTELERICLKALAKRASDRYATAAELADDLLHWNQSPQQKHNEQQIVPKGLRSFDANDSDFFVDLLPGPRNREGLPESIAFWKSRIEETDSDKTFAVGLIYGPSGCGKSSLVKAGLLPRLSGSVIALYVEGTPDETEARILRAIRKHISDSPHDLGLAETFMLLRRDAGRRVVIVLDQFEQWLHAHRAEQNTDLLNALRQCDGEHLQAVVVVRDDFGMAAARFMDALDIPVRQGINYATVDLFDVDHAEKVLIKFGRAFGKLPAQTDKLSEYENAFVSAVAQGLSQDGKVVSVRLALFAEMVKSKAWTAKTLQEVGGTEGIGVNFLEETFAARTANPKHRQHQAAAREVLKSLLPEAGSDIKGHMRSHAELLEASGYKNRLKESDELLRILDGELRLISPTDPAGFESDSDSDPGSKYYQLAHDYLVPSLRDWLTRKQRETNKGRAELRLAERSALWNAKPENRHLPSVWEWLRIRTLTEKNKWTEQQRKTMKKAGRMHGLRSSLAGTAVVLVVYVGLIVAGRLEQRQNANYAKALVESLSAANTADVEELVVEIDDYRQWATPLLKEIVANENSSPTAKFHASLVLVKNDPSHVEFLLRELLSASPDDVPVIVSFLEPHKKRLQKQLWETIQAGSNSQRMRAAAALSQYDAENERWEPEREDVVTSLVSVPASESDEWIEMLRPVGALLADPLEHRFRDSSERRRTERPIVAAALSVFLDDKPKSLMSLILLAENDEEFLSLLESLRNHRQSVISELQTLVSQSPPAGAKPDERDAFWKKQANAAACLLALGETASVWPLFQQTPDPSLRSFMIDRFARLGVTFDVLATQIQQESDPASRYALILTLGQFDGQKLSSEQRQSFTDQLAKLYRDDPDPGVHSGAKWTLRNWQQNSLTDKIDLELRDTSRQERNWFVNSQGQTFAVVNGPAKFLMGEKNKPKSVTLSHSFAVATHEVTVEQFQKFRSDYKHDEQYAPQAYCPANYVSWYDCVAYCNWLNEQEGIPKDQWCYEGEYALRMKIAADFLSRTGYRLPTEEEWEFVCRAGTTSKYGFGEPLELLPQYAWYSDISKSHMWSVGLKLPNRYGTFDMHGNAWEWNHGWSTSFYASLPPLTNADLKLGVPRVMRGGSFGDPPAVVRSAVRSFTDNRYLLLPADRDLNYGFRLSRTYK